MDKLVDRAFEELRVEMKKATGVTLNKQDELLYKGAFYNGFVSCLNALQAGKIPADVLVKTDTVS